MARYRFPAAGRAASGAASAQNDGRRVVCQTALEVQFPHILTSIQALWGFKELNAYFTKLTLDERGNRAGFPAEIWDEIHTLLRLHQEIMPEPLFAGNESRHALDFART